MNTYIIITETTIIETTDIYAEYTETTIVETDCIPFDEDTPEGFFI